jgi:uncharacterized damage-inducible protein DinB
MMSLADRFRRWNRYEQDCNAKALAMIESVPESARGGERFHRAIGRMAHLVAARRRWLHRLGRWPDLPELFPSEVAWAELPRQVATTEAAWRDFLEPLSDGDLANEFEWTADDGRRYRWTLDELLTQLFGHAWYHRGQIAQLVAELGGRTVDTDYIYWCELPALEPASSPSPAKVTEPRS